MPTLPSGLTLGLSPEAIPEEMPVHWFECPDGHFWYEAPDVSLSPPPWSRDEPPSFQDYLHAPVPCDRSALAPFVRVMRRDPDGVWWWAGDTLADFPRYTVLDDADLAAWRAWLARPEVGATLDAWVERCRAQARGNGGASGFAVFRGGPR